VDLSCLMIGLKDYAHPLNAPISIYGFMWNIVPKIQIMAHVTGYSDNRNLHSGILTEI
jgi:hypothetical protein